LNSLIEISTFVRVVEATGFTAAARQLGLSPPVVSTRVQALESRLGTRLLNRTTRSLSLTEAGKTYYDRCVRILAELDDAESAVRSAHTTPAGLIKLNTCPLVEDQVTSLICEFIRVASGFSFQVTSSHRMVDLVGEGHDLAIRAGTLSDSTLLTRRLGCARLVLCAAPSYLATSSPPTHVDQLRSHKCLAVSGSGATVEWLFTKDAAEYKVRPSHVFLANNAAALRLAALSGLGIALLPESSVADQLNSARLVRVLSDHEPAMPDIHAVFQPRSQTAARVRTFVDFVAARLKRDRYAIETTLSAQSGYATV